MLTQVIALSKIIVRQLVDLRALQAACLALLVTIIQILCCCYNRHPLSANLSIQHDFRGHSHPLVLRLQIQYLALQFNDLHLHLSSLGLNPIPHAHPQNPTMTVRYKCSDESPSMRYVRIRMLHLRASTGS